MQQGIWFGKYRILGLLGHGGSSEVYLAEHIKLNSFRAIKFISRNHPLYDLQCKEALILKNLKHSCIPIIYDIEENEDGSYIVEQYLEGETLRNFIKGKGPLREEVILNYGLQLCDLIGYLHREQRPILYVDLKPENIILTGSSLKLIDFGSAIFRDETSENRGYYGTKGYAAPELYHRQRIDERCDVYGIGMLLYFMVTGKDSRLSKSINHIDYIGTCSKRLKKVIDRCLKFYPAQRYSSVADLSKELSALLRTNQSRKEPGNTVNIAVAGAQRHIGVTHLALRLCKFLQGQGKTCLYQECNESGAVQAIMNCYDDVRISEGIRQVEQIPMVSLGQKPGQEGEDFHYIIRDLGVLTEDNLEEFLKGAVKLLILGGKDWELMYAEQVIRFTAEYKDILYLFNFVDSRQFQLILNSMKHRECLRIPYEPNPYAPVKPKSEQDFYKSLLRFEGRRIC